MYFSAQQYGIVAGAFVLSATLTALVRAVARRWNVVAQPKLDRWHSKPTALLGGVAIFITTAVMFAVVGPFTHQSLMVIAGSTLLFAVGLVDDLKPLKPYQKLVSQFTAGGLVIVSGLVLPWTGLPLLDMTLTMLWLVGITNAMNLLDNMDGLAAGVAAIAAVVLAFNCGANERPVEALALAAFAATLVGFLVFNFNPASIFMGDCGSMFIGFFLSGSAMLSISGGRSRSVLSVLAVPVLVLLIPIFDVMLVTILRKLAGRSAAQGGRDHTSHRLVALGMTERRAVCMLYLFAATTGGLALAVRELPIDTSIAAIVSLVLLLTLLGIHLSGVHVYELQASPRQPVASFFIGLSHRRRVFEVSLDVVLIALSFHMAHVLVLGPVAQTADYVQFGRMLTLLVMVNLPVFLALGVYRGLWRYLSIDNALVYAKAVLAGSIVAAAVVVLVFGRQSLSPAVFVLNTLLLVALMVGSRLSFRLLRRSATAASGQELRRVLIYGAGDGGEFILRALRDNPTSGRKPIGFADDNPTKVGKVLHGLTVLCGRASLDSVLREQQVDEVIISSLKFQPSRIQQIIETCERVQVPVNRMSLQIEAVTPNDAFGASGSEEALCPVEVTLTTAPGS